MHHPNHPHYTVNGARLIGLMYIDIYGSLLTNIEASWLLRWIPLQEEQQCAESCVRNSRRYQCVVTGERILLNLLLKLNKVLLESTNQCQTWHDDPPTLPSISWKQVAWVLVGSISIINQCFWRVIQLWQHWRNNNKLRLRIWNNVAETWIMKQMLLQLQL